MLVLVTLIQLLLLCCENKKRVAFFAMSWSPSVGNRMPKKHVWLVVTGLTLAFNVAAAVIFALDIQYPVKVSIWKLESRINQNRFFFQVIQDCPDYKDKLNPYLISTLILPIFFSWGVFFFIATVSLWMVMLCSPTEVPAKENQRQRTLSDVPSDYEDTIEKRFKAAEKIEEEDNRRSQVIVSSVHDSDSESGIKMKRVKTSVRDSPLPTSK